jgi:hypothetical protein
VYGSFWSKKGVWIEPPAKIITPSSNVFFNPNDSAAYSACAGGSMTGGTGTGTGGTGTMPAFCAHPTLITTAQSLQTAAAGGSCFQIAQPLLGRNGAVANVNFPQGINAGSYSLKAFDAANDNATTCQTRTTSATNTQITNIPIGPSTDGGVYLVLTPNNAPAIQLNVIVTPWTNGTGCSTLGAKP